MTNLTLYNDFNSQEITLVGLVDDTGTPVNTAVITGNITRCGNVLSGGTLSFSPVANVPGSYVSTLNTFDAPVGRAEVEISGSDSGATFNFSIFATIAERSL